MTQFPSSSPNSSLQQWWQALWKSHAPMIALAVLCAGLGVFFTAGIFLDPRYITAQPVWLKPLKFAISTVLYFISMAWLLSHLPPSRLKSIASNTIAVMLTLEVVVIALQAARGQTSHFNVSDVFNGAIYSLMGTMIAVLWVANLVLAVLLLRQRLTSTPMGLAMNLGLIIAVIGMAQAFLMTNPTAQQMAGLEAGIAETIVGAHTVGLTDGGAGLPVTGWSTQGGDLRVGHFIGIHALQILPLLAWLLASTTFSAARRSRLIAIAGAYYLSITLLLTWQALRAESLIAPSALTVTVFSALTALAIIAAVTLNPRAMRSA